MHNHEMPVFDRSRTPTLGHTTTIILLSPQQLREKGIFYHPNHLRRLWTRGEFPKPINLSPHKIAWREADIDAWIASKFTRGEADEVRRAAAQRAAAASISAPSNLVTP